MTPTLTESTRRRAALATLALVALTLPACQQWMGWCQPSYRPLEESEFFDDKQAARPQVDGVVTRGHDRSQIFNPNVTTDGLPDRLDPYFVSGKTEEGFGSELPFEVNLHDLERGRERYNIYCSVCHDRLGTGHGKIVLRGFTPPPNLIKDNSRGMKLWPGKDVPLREAPLGYFVNVITHGYGAMPAHASQIPARDRWLIAAYVRTLQISQEKAPAAE